MTRTERPLSRKWASLKACVATTLFLIGAPALGAAGAPLQWFYLTDRLAFPAGVDVAVALGATLDIKKIKRALPAFKVDAEDLEGLSTVAISYANDNETGVLLYPKDGKIAAIQTYGSAGNSLGVRTGMPIDQVPGATPSKCGLDELTGVYDCVTGSAFHYRVDPSKCLLLPLPDKLPAFADCLTIVSMVLGALPAQ